MSEKNPIQALIEKLGKLPGIGEKSASRLAYFILRSKGSYAADLAFAITEMKEQIVLCSVCRDLTPDDPCRICSNTDRDRSLVMVVEEPHDLQAIEKSGVYNGLYHVLHGTLSPQKNINPKSIELEALQDRVKSESLKEVILATNPSVEGEATAAFIAEALAGFTLKVTRIARGIPVGADLEYVDRHSLDQAIKGRGIIETGK